jgi:hypothetical protein
MTEHEKQNEKMLHPLFIALYGITVGLYAIVLISILIWWLQDE